MKNIYNKKISENMYNIKPGDYVSLDLYFNLKQDERLWCYVDSLHSEAASSETNTLYRTKYWKLIVVEYKGKKPNILSFNNFPENALELITDQSEINRLDKVRTFK